MSKAYILGMIVGIVFALIFALISYFTNKMRYKCKFDERQILARGKAFQAGFFTMIGYYMIYGILDVSEIQWCEDFIGIMLGIFLGMAVFVIMATHNDAYMAMNKSLSRYIVLSIFIIAANLVGALGNFIDGSRW